MPIVPKGTIAVILEYCIQTHINKIYGVFLYLHGM